MAFNLNFVPILLPRSRNTFRVLHVGARNLSPIGSWPLSITIHHFVAYHFDARAYQTSRNADSTPTTELAVLRTRAHLIEHLLVRGYRRHARLHVDRALCNLGVNLALREDGELMQHRQATTPVEGRRDGRRSIARTLPGLSMGWVVSRPGCIRPPSLCKPGDPPSPLVPAFCPSFGPASASHLYPRENAAMAPSL